MDPAAIKILEISRINLMFSWLIKSVGGAKKATDAITLLFAATSLDVVEQGHETVVHVELLMAVEQS